MTLVVRREKIPAMPECFDVAAIRHFRDGGLLCERQFLDNADQLFGFATECALKSALLTLPGCAQQGELARCYREEAARCVLGGAGLIGQRGR